MLQRPARAGLLTRHTRARWLVLAWALLWAASGVTSLAIAADASRFDEPTAGISPHGGFTLQTDRCRQCHASHGATGSRHLLRNDSVSSDCVYCHAAEGSGAGRNVYTENTNNGHTPGWMAADKFTSGYSVPDTTTGTIGARGNTVSPGVSNVAQTLIPGGSNEHTESAGLSHLYEPGDSFFGCTSCHDSHGARLIPFSFVSLNTSGGAEPGPPTNKLLRSDPSRGNNQPGYGVSSELAVVDGWIQAVPGEAKIGTGKGGRAYNLTLWCLDCHDSLRAGMPGNHPGYSNDTAPASRNANDGSVPACYNCHAATVDFPHSGSGDSFALLGRSVASSSAAGSITNRGTRASTYEDAVLDPVCLDCHTIVSGPKDRVHGGLTTATVVTTPPSQPPFK